MFLQCYQPAATALAGCKVPWNCVCPVYFKVSSLDSLPASLPCTGLSQPSQGAGIPKNWSYQQRIRQKGHWLPQSFPHPLPPGAPSHSTAVHIFPFVRMDCSWAWRRWSLNINQFFWTQDSLPWDSSKQNAEEANLCSSEVYGCSCDICLVLPISGPWTPQSHEHCSQIWLWPSHPWLVLPRV